MISAKGCRAARGNEAAVGGGLGTYKVRLGVLGPTPPISSYPIELKEEDASSSINDSSAPVK